MNLRQLPMEVICGVIEMRGGNNGVRPRTRDTAAPKRLQALECEKRRNDW
jgi:hypothetical protein